MRWSQADLAAFAAAAGGLKTRRNKALWARDPVAWVSDRLGEFVWSKQAEILHAVATEPRTAVQSCHGIGKSHIASRAGLWYIDTAEYAGDRFLVTTAPTSAQVKAVLWRYIRQGHLQGELDGRVMQTAEWKMPMAVRRNPRPSDDTRPTGARPKTYDPGDDLVGYGRKPADWQSSAFQGIHAPDGVMVIIDEACGVAKQLFVDSDSLATTDSSRVLAIGNPDDNGSHFHAVCTSESGWARIKVSAFDSPNLTGEEVPPAVAHALVRRSWVKDKQIRWGEQNPLYIAKVLGEFADSVDGLIPLSWVRAANARWHAWNERRLDELARHGVAPEPPGRRIYGVDVAWLGEDKTAIVTRQGDIVCPDGALEVERHAKEDTTITAGRVEAKVRSHPTSHAVVDVIGVGAGVYDMLARKGVSVSAFNAAQGTRRRDSTGEWKFSNKRSAAWWNLRELLDPARGATLALPEDDELTADLCAPKYEPRAGGLIEVESKDKIRKRLQRSTDSGDGLVMACWTDIEDPADADLPPPAEAVLYEVAKEAGYVPVGAPTSVDLLDIGDYGAPDEYL